MKKLVTIILGLIIASVFATTVSAEEYEVQKGDTLWDIAKEHNITVNTLMEINGLNSSVIFPKQVLKIDESDVEYHVVEKGDTLSEISKAYGEEITIVELKAWNGLSSDLIITGQELVVNGAEPVNQNEIKQANQTARSNNQSMESKKEVSIASAEVEEKQENKSNVESKSIEEEAVTEQESNSEGKTLTVEATAYTAYCNGCSGITATGINLKENRNAKVIAVDPNLIPLGSKVYVEGYGQAVAGDTGGAIKGNKIDIHLPTKQQAYSWGRRTVEVTILE